MGHGVRLQVGDGPSLLIVLSQPIGKPCGLDGRWRFLVLNSRLSPPSPTLTKRALVPLRMMGRADQTALLLRPMFGRGFGPW